MSQSETWIFRRTSTTDSTVDWVEVTGDKASPRSSTFQSRVTKQQQAAAQFRITLTDLCMYDTMPSTAALYCRLYFCTVHIFFRGISCKGEACVHEHTWVPMLSVMSLLLHILQFDCSSWLHDVKINLQILDS